MSAGSTQGGGATTVADMLKASPLFRKLRASDGERASREDADGGGGGSTSDDSDE